MPKTISIEEAERNLRGLLQSLDWGEAVTVTGEDGAPVAQIRSIREREKLDETPEEKDWEPHHEWTRAMEELAQEVDRLWDGKKSALEELRDERDARS